MSTPESLPFAQRLWARYTRYATHAPHMQLARRIYRMHGDRLPLLTALQRRWLPAAPTPFQHQLLLPYMQPYLSLGLGSLSTPPVQRRSEVLPISPRVTRAGGMEVAAVPHPMVAVQRAGATPRNAPGGTEGGNGETQQVQRQAIPLGIATPTTATGRQMGTMPAAAAVPLPLRGAIQRSTIPPTSSAVQQPTALGVASFNRVSRVPGQSFPDRAGTAPGQIVYRSMAFPGQQSDTGSGHPSPSVIQRHVDADSSGHQMPLAEGRAPTHLSLMRTTVPSASTSSRSALVAGSVLAAGSAPVAGLPPAFPVVASPALGRIILQRHLTTSPSSRDGAVSSTQSMPTLPLMLQRFRPTLTALESVSRTGASSAGALPLARFLDPSVAISGSGQAVPAPLFNAPTPLPLVPSIARGAVTSVQRQTEQSMASNAMTTTTNMPPSVSVSTPDGMAPTTAATTQNQADELAEIVWRKLMRRLTVEGERRGRRPWP